MLRLALGLAAATIAAAPALSRSPPFTPAPGDTSLRSKCRAEAARIGGGGRGALQQITIIRQMRRDHFRTCMREG